MDFGFTLVEMIAVVSLIAILTTIAVPPLQRMRATAAIQSGRHMVTSALSLANATGTGWGRTTVLRIDPIRDELRVVVDTGGAGSGMDTLVVREYRLWDDLRVDLDSDREALCFNSRGVGTVAAQCPEVGAHIVLRYGPTEDTVVVNSVGRVRR